VVGIGHELRGDDAAGVAVARRLKTRSAAVLVVDAGSAPENHTGALRRFGPDVVVFVDSAQMGVAPGTVRRLRQEAASGVTASTHTLPVSVLARYLERDLRCAVELVGIQPARNGVGDPLSPRVARAAAILARALDDILKDAGLGSAATTPTAG
jgi:hydrogenase 3 maturation protease